MKKQARGFSNTINFSPFTLLVLVGIFFFAGLLFNKHGPRSESTSTITPIKSDLTAHDYCRNSNSYRMEPRFQRALSLLSERSSNTNPKNSTAFLRFYLPSLLPCLDIQYCSSAEIGTAEGIFSFSEEMANRNRLLICVSENYKQEDDLLTSTLLAHEVAHAIQFVLIRTGAKNVSCYKQEAIAYGEVILYTLSLTDGELESLFARMYDFSIYNPRIGSLRNLVDISLSLDKVCNSQQVDQSLCFANGLYSKIEEILRADTYYQKQCEND